MRLRLNSDLSSIMADAQSPRHTAASAPVIFIRRSSTPSNLNAGGTATISSARRRSGTVLAESWDERSIVSARYNPAAGTK